MEMNKKMLLAALLAVLLVAVAFVIVDGVTAEESVEDEEIEEGCDGPCKGGLGKQMHEERLERFQTADLDSDGIPDCEDPDDDGDGINDSVDDYPHDHDNDGIPDHRDDDDDDDGILDSEDDEYVGNTSKREGPRHRPRDGMRPGGGRPDKERPEGEEGRPEGEGPGGEGRPEGEGPEGEGEEPARTMNFGGFFSQILNML